MNTPIRNAALATILGAALAISATPALADHGQHRGWRNRGDNCEQSRGYRNTDWQNDDEQGDRCRNDRNADWRDQRGDACGADGYQGDVSWQDDGYYTPEQRVVVVERPVYVPVVPRREGLTISLSGLFGGNPFSAHVEHHPMRQTPVTYRSWANSGRQVAYRR